MFCSNCGKQIAETDKFCCGCGAPVETFSPAEPEPVCEPEICTTEAPVEEPCCECTPEAPVEEPCCECASEAPVEEPCCECAPEAPHDTTAYPAYNFGMPAEEPSAIVQETVIPEPAVVPEYPAYTPAPEAVYEQPAAPVYEAFEPPVIKHKNGARVILGALLILLAAAPYVLPYFVDFNTNTIITALMYSDEHYSIVSAFKSLLGMAEPLFYFTASMTSLAAGCALIMKHRGGAKMLKASVVINVIAVAFGVVCAGAFYFIPDLIVRALGGGSSYAELAVLLMTELPQVLLYLLNPAIFHVAACLIALVVSILIKNSTKTAWESTDLYAKDKGGAIIVIPYVMAIAKLAVMLVERYILMYQDSLYLSISTIAQTLFTNYFKVFVLAFVVLGVVIAVIGRKVNALPLSILWTVLVAAAAAVVITGGYDMVVSYLRSYGIGTEYYSIVSNTFIAYAGVTAIWFIAMGIWMITSARGAFPVWVQIILGIVSLAVYGALEFVKGTLGLAFYIQIGSLGVLAVVLVASIVGNAVLKSRAEKEDTFELSEPVYVETVQSGEETEL